MIYLVCQDWLNTSGNHAGMSYLCAQLVSMHPESYKSYQLPSFLPPLSKRKKNKILKKIQMFHAKLKHWLFLRKIFGDMRLQVKKGDSVFLLEYMEVMYPMKSFAKKVKKKLGGTQVLAMIHLVPSKLDVMFPKQQVFDSWIDYTDNIITLGSSLTNYLCSRGVASQKVLTSFHYVDDFYFQPIEEHRYDRLRVIAMGSQMRNVSLLSRICRENPMVDFVICQGLSDMSSYFCGCKNVRLIPFVSEIELRQLMMESDVSLNVMEDTVGSNVVVTSLAMGLAMICSDVGSIRDYCTEENSVFCDNADPDSFSRAVQKLSLNRDVLNKMRQSSQNMARKFSIANFHCNLQDFLQTR